MKIEILKATVCGGQNVSAGQVVDASAKDASLLISLDKAKAYQIMDSVKAKPKRKPSTRKKTAK